MRDINVLIRVELQVNGKPIMHDIKDDIRRACESMLPSLVETTTEMIARFGTLPHLPRRTVRKRDGMDVLRSNALLNEINDPADDGKRLPRPGTGDDQERAVDGFHGLFLNFVQAVKYLV